MTTGVVLTKLVNERFDGLGNRPSVEQMAALRRAIGAAMLRAAAVEHKRYCEEGRCDRHAELLEEARKLEESVSAVVR